MSIEYIAQIDIGKELTEEEITELCEAGKENEMELHDSGRGWLSVWSKNIWSIDDEEKRIIKLDINEINESYKKAVEKYGGKVEMIFSMIVN